MLLAEHSKAQCLRIISHVGTSQKRFDELFNHFTGKDPILTQRASWPVSYIIEAHPKLIFKHFGKLVKHMQDPQAHVAVKRNSMRLLQNVEIPEKFQGEIMNLCFEYITRINEAAAVKAFALTVLENLCKIYPEIKPEIITIIETQWEFEGPAFRARARRIINRES